MHVPITQKAHETHRGKGFTCLQKWKKEQVETLTFISLLLHTNKVTLPIQLGIPKNELGYSMLVWVLVLMNILELDMIW
jgi:hypothetical protein